MGLRLFPEVFATAKKGAYPTVHRGCAQHMELYTWFDSPSVNQKVNIQIRSMSGVVQSKQIASPTHQQVWPAALVIIGNSRVNVYARRPAPQGLTVKSDKMYA